MAHADEIESLLHTVGLIYSTALDPCQSSNVLCAVNDRLHGAGAQLVRFDRSTGEILFSETGAQIAKRLNDDYVQHWGALDPRREALAEFESGSVIRCHELFDDQFVARNSYYQEFLIPAGYRWVVEGTVHLKDGTSTILANLRACDAPCFSEQDAKFMRRLLPHLQRALELQRDLQEKLVGQHIDGILHALPQPCLVLDRSGHVLVANAAVSAALGELRATIADRRLRFAQPRIAAEWSRLLQDVRVAGLGRRMQVDVEQGNSWTIHVIPWRCFGIARDAFEQGLQIVTLERSEAHAAPRLRSMITHDALTAAEGAVLNLLAAGMRPKEIAKSRGSSVNTVRSQIRSILEKTGTHSQVALLAKLR